MDAVSMNRRRVEWNKMPSFRRQQLRGYCSDLAGLGGFELGTVACPSNSAFWLCFPCRSGPIFRPQSL